MKEKVYSKVDELPHGRASDKLTEGCIVLEGGAFRGLYTQGVLDALMEEDINMSCTIGVSAGAMSGVNYVSRQIGRAATINLTYRHDPHYVGIEAMKHNGGIIGFDFVFSDMEGIEPLDNEALYDSRRRFVIVATNCQTGQPVYFERGDHDLQKMIQASASMPYVSKMVMIDGIPYLDGGCSDKIPYHYAMKEGYKKIIVVKTRTHEYRADLANRHTENTQLIYRHYPEFAKAFIHSEAAYNVQLDQLDRLEEKGRIFVFTPQKDLAIARIEGDMEKLGEQYYLGYDEAKRRMKELRAYLEA